MKLNLSKSALNLTKESIQIEKEVFSAASSSWQEEEEEENRKDSGPVINPAVFLPKKQKRKWERLPENRKQKLIQKEQSKIQIKNHLKAGMPKDSFQRFPHRKGRSGSAETNSWIQIKTAERSSLSAVDGKNSRSAQPKRQVWNQDERNLSVSDSGLKERVEEKKTVQIKVPINSVTTKELKSGASKAGQAMAGTAGGIGITLETAKRVASKFQQNLRMQEQQKQETLQKMAVSAEQEKKQKESWTDADSLGRTAGNITAAAVTPVIHAVSTLATTLAASLMSVLLPVLCAAFLVAAVVAVLTSVFGGAATPAVSGTAIVQVAEQELAEADRNIGGQKYKEWYGINDNWCAMFVSWCADQCGYIESGIMPKSASVSTLLQWFQEQDLYQEADSSYEPKAGDIILFKETMSHTGIVVGYDAKTDRVTTIEGNAGVSDVSPFHQGSRVTKNVYQRTSRMITGYGTPKYPDSVAGTLPGDSNAEKIFHGCVQAGYSEEAAAAIVGNLYQEAGQDANGDINLHAAESTGEGIGMVQWSFGRKTAFLQFCERQGQPWPNTSVEVQLNYMLYELSTNQWIWSRNSAEYGADCNISLTDFKTCSDIEFATRVFCAKFERCHLRDANLSYRQQMARSAYESYAK